jgi:DNA-binding transcriptional LysR family regulator
MCASRTSSSASTAKTFNRSLIHDDGATEDQDPQNSAKPTGLWMDTPLDAEFSPVRQRQADADLGWLTATPDALPAPLDAMTLGEFEPDLWIPASHPAARRGSIDLGEVASMDVIFGPARAEPGTYDPWTSIVRAMNPRFEVTGPPLRHLLPVVLAFAATAGRPAAVLTDPTAIAGPPLGVIRLPRPAGTGDMARVRIASHRVPAIGTAEPALCPCAAA